jgi:hypothetical protein
MRPLIQPWTMSPAAAGLETIHTMIRTATMMPMIFANNGFASRSGPAAALLSRSDVPGKLPGQKLTNQPSSRAEPHTIRLANGAIALAVVQRDQAKARSWVRPLEATASERVNQH